MDSKSPKPLPFWRQLYAQVVVAIVLGVAVGHFEPAWGVALKPLGDGFVMLIRMIIAPLIFLTIVTGIAKLRELKSFARIAGKAFLYFLLFSTLALLVGLAVANIVRPGAGLHVDPATLDIGKIADYAAKAHDRTLTGFVLNVIPQTLLFLLVGGKYCRCF